MTTDGLNDDEIVKPYLVEWSRWIDAPNPDVAAKIALDMIVNRSEVIFVVKDETTIHGTGRLRFVKREDTNDKR